MRETGPAAETLKLMAAQHRHQEKTFQQRFSLCENDTRTKWMQLQTKPLSHISPTSCRSYFFKPKMMDNVHHFAKGFYIGQEIQQQFHSQQQRQSHHPLRNSYHQYQQYQNNPHHFVQHQQITNIKRRLSGTCLCSAESITPSYQQNTSYFHISQHKTQDFHHTPHNNYSSHSFLCDQNDLYSQASNQTIFRYPYHSTQLSSIDVPAEISSSVQPSSTHHQSLQPDFQLPNLEHVSVKLNVKNEKPDLFEFPVKSLQSSSCSFLPISVSSPAIPSTSSQSSPVFSKNQIWGNFQNSQLPKPSAQIHPFMVPETNKKKEESTILIKSQSETAIPSLLDEQYDEGLDSCNQSSYNLCDSILDESAFYGSNACVNFFDDILTK